MLESTGESEVAGTLHYGSLASLMDEECRGHEFYVEEDPLVERGTKDIL